MLIFLFSIAIYAALNVAIFEVIVHPHLSDEQRTEWAQTPVHSALVITFMTLPAAILSMFGALR